MVTFKHFEKKVIRFLLEPLMEPDQVNTVLEFATPVSYEFTGVGYYLTVRHPSLPLQRAVCGEPMLNGSAGGVDCGFVVFLENGELTLECHSWGDTSIPDDFRKQQVEVEWAN